MGKQLQPEEFEILHTKICFRMRKRSKLMVPYPVSPATTAGKDPVVGQRMGHVRVHQRFQSHWGTSLNSFLVVTMHQTTLQR